MRLYLSRNIFQRVLRSSSRLSRRNRTCDSYIQNDRVRNGRQRKLVYVASCSDSGIYIHVTRNAYVKTENRKNKDERKPESGRIIEIPIK